MYPDCPAAVRLGIGLCRYQLKQYGKAKQAFERVLQASDIRFQSSIKFMQTYLLEVDVGLIFLKSTLAVGSRKRGGSCCSGNH